jgi:hypothetical protein
VLKVVKSKNRAGYLKIFHPLKAHKVAFGLLLAGYGIFYLSSVVLSGWSLSDWGNNIITYLFFPANSVLSSSLLNPLFFITSLPTLIIGTVILSIYSMFKIKPGAVDNKERVAIVLTVFGFAYQIIGAWPLGIKSIFPWEWQKQIIGFGAIFAWTLTVLSLFALVAGGVSLYSHSKIHHQKHPEFNQIIIEN